MARTRLLHRLATLLRHARDPVAAERDALRLPRRRFLAAAGALAGCAVGTSYRDILQAPALPIAGAATGVDVVVVGAGLAGLTAAWRLRRAGVDATVFEAGGRVGGRAFTARDTFAVKAELGGELIDTRHTAIRALCAELGLSLVDAEDDARSFERERYFLQGTAWTEAQVLAVLRPLYPLIARDLAAVGTGPVTWEHHTPGAEAIDQLSLAGWMDRNGVSGLARALLDVAFTSEMGLAIERQSALGFLWTLGRSADRVALYGDSDERYVVREGSDAIAQRLAAGAGAVRHDHCLIALRPRSDGRVRCVFDRGGTAVEVDAARVVLALPFSQLRRCEIAVPLPRVKRRVIDELPYGTNAKVLVGVLGRPWRESGSSGTSFSDGGAYHESWDSARGFPGEAAVLTAFSGGELGVRVGESNPEAQGRRFVDAIDVVYPGTANAFTGRTARMHWPSARYFEGSYSAFGPGDVTSLGGAAGFAVDRLHFAGEHTSDRAQGYMEGAVESGERCAREVLAAR